jgi:hypothetical protein
MALFDTNSGLENLLGNSPNLFMTTPSYITGLLTKDEQDKLKQQALLKGLVGTAATYLATPKNQNYGSALPYLAKSYIGGMGAAQDVYDASTKNALDRLTLEKTAKTMEMQGMTELDKLIAQRDKIAQLNPNDPKLKIYDDAIKTKSTRGEGINLNLGSPVAGVDAQGNPVFFQPSKTGGTPSIIQGIKPPESSTNKLTEGERTAGFLSERLNNSLQQLQTVTGQEPSAAAPNIAAEAIKFFTRSDYLKNLANPESRQQVEAAQYDILDSALTLGTGAAYTREQLESYRKSYFPQLGDKEKTIQDKATRLQGLLDAAYKKSGRAAPSETKTEVKAKTVVRTGKDKSGKTVIQYSDGSIGYGN